MTIPNFLRLFELIMIFYWTIWNIFLKSNQTVSQTPEVLLDNYTDQISG